jgi:hypothetical protein
MPTMASLIHKVTEETMAQEYRTIASYMEENQTLEEELELHRKVWNGTIMVANTVIIAVKTIEKSLIAVNVNAASAEKDWLAFWGIYEESPGPHPPWL